MDLLSDTELPVFEEMNFEEVWEKGMHHTKCYGEAHH